MTERTKWVLFVSLGLIILIILLVLFLKVNVDLKNQILSSLNLILIFAYVVTMVYLVSKNEELVSINEKLLSTNKKFVSTNKKLVSTYEQSLCLQNTPVITAEIHSQLVMLIAIRRLTEEDENDLENINTTKLIITNHSRNNAMDVRINITAFVNERQVNSSPPLDGSKDWHIQAGHKVMKPFKIQEDYLASVNCTIESLTEVANESNKDKQLVLKLQISYSDGSGKKIENPALSWFFDFRKKTWEFVI